MEKIVLKVNDIQKKENVICTHFYKIWFIIYKYNCHSVVLVLIFKSISS